MNIQKTYSPGKPANITIKGFTEILNEGKKKEFSVFINVKPELAKHILENYNQNNRTLSKVTIEKYARDISNGRWEHNSVDTSCFDVNGTLADGQHRLAAIIKADKSLPIKISFGVSENYRSMQGKGRAKSLSDTLAILGTKINTQHGASMINLAQSFTRNPYKPNTHITNSPASDAEKLDFFNKNKTSITTAMNYVIGLGANSKNRIMPPSLAAFTYWVLSNTSHPESVVENFMNKLLTGTGLVKTDPVIYVRNRLIGAAKNNVNRHQSVRDELISLTMHAFNDTVEGKVWHKCKQENILSAGVPQINGLDTLANIKVYEKK